MAAVWIANGLFCKLLDLVPRHREIVARILGEEHSLAITRMIGVAEIAMAVWVLSGIAPRLNAIAQIAIVVAMNILEFCLAPDLLLFGRLNAVVASGFVGLIYYREFYLQKS
ncbi:MAG TPA: DoxX-like family protein [Pyrinomonadaceae bacterium]|nr:DoxX-like family protein [Pyrinomonadaceae bacterium]